MEHKTWIIKDQQDNSPQITMIRYNELLLVYQAEGQCRLHRLADQLNNVLLADMYKTGDQQKIQAKAHHLIIQHKEDLRGNHLQINMVSDLPPISLAGEQMRIPLLTDMDNTNEQREIRVEANHLIILPKEDRQVNHLQINMVNDHRQIQPISLTGGRNHMPPLVDLLNNVPMTDTDNTNDLCKKEIKDRHHSSLLMHPTEIHLHIPPLLDPLSNVPLTDKDNTGSRRRNQDQQRNRTKASFLILIQKRYQGISLVIITINILPIKKYIVRFP